MKKAMSFLAGAGAGAVIALLYAPQSGKRTQKLIAKNVHKGVDQIVAAGKKGQTQAQALLDKGLDLLGQGEDLVNTGKKRLVEAWEAGKETYRKQMAAIR